MPNNKNKNDFSYIEEWLEKSIKVANEVSSLAKENKIPIIVFSILEKDSLISIIKGKGSFTKIS